MVALIVMGITWAAQAEVRDSQPQSIRFDNPFSRTETAKHQLGGIISIVQDAFGFMWFGGENGLGRYDGRNMKLYQFDPNDPRSLPGNLMSQLVVDRDGVFWQAGEAGLSRYHQDTDDFSHITEIGGVPFASRAVSGLAVGADNTLYVGGAVGLHVISPDRSTMRIHLLKLPQGAGPHVQYIRALAIDAKGLVWIATGGMGAASFDPVTQQFQYFPHIPNDPKSLAHDHVRAVLADDQGRIWFGTYGAGISRLNTASGGWDHFSYCEAPGCLGSNIVSGLAQDSEGAVWVALDQGGLALFDESTQRFHHYRHSRYEPTSLVSNQLRAIYEDRNRDLWIGAFPSGASFYNRSTRIFRHFLNSPNDPHSVSDNGILNFLQASDGTIWVGTENGLNAFDPQTGKFQRYLSDPFNPQGLQAKPVLSLEEDIDGYLWVGTWAGGLHRFNPKTGVFRHYSSDSSIPNSLKNDFIWSILRTRDNTVWVGTEDAGLFRYQRESDSFLHYKHGPNEENTIADEYVPALLEDSNGILWIGTFGGLDKFDPITNTFSHVAYGTGESDSTSSKNIRALYEDSRGWIWVGTEQLGVDVYKPEAGKFVHLGIADGLPSANISSITEDVRGDIWLATTHGLARVNPHNFSINHFRREDGIAGSNFNRNASLSDQQGNLYFGSTEGITVFHPEDLDRITAEFPVYITQFRLFNQEVPIAADSPLQTSVLLTDQIHLTHTDTMFSFELVALNYRQSASMRYSYMLKGFDRDWNNIGQNTTATYTNINPGDYTFRTRASTDGEKWVEGQSLMITIAPPPWRTGWAYASYIMLLGVLLFFASKYITLRIRAEAYRSKAITDPLTGLPNRAGTAQIADGVFSNAQTKKGMCLMLMDIDHFKRINDRRGHDAGDRILCKVAEAARECLRGSDHLGRWGGEEFVLLCATHNSTNSQFLAEKLRNGIANQVYEQQDQSPVRVTVSVGIAELQPNDSFESALKRADIALYQAKANGRNCVVLG